MVIFIVLNSFLLPLESIYHFSLTFKKGYVFVVTCIILDLKSIYYVLLATWLILILPG